MKEKKLYQIRRILDGHLSSGGSTPSFSEKNGKVWSGIGSLRNHIVMITRNQKYLVNKNLKHPYEDCEILEIEMIPKRIYPAIEEILGVFEREKEKQRKRDYYK